MFKERKKKYNKLLLINQVLSKCAITIQTDTLYLYEYITVLCICI